MPGFRVKLARQFGTCSSSAPVSVDGRSSDKQLGFFIGGESI